MNHFLTIANPLAPPLDTLAHIMHKIFATAVLHVLCPQPEKKGLRQKCVVKMGKVSHAKESSDGREGRSCCALATRFRAIPRCGAERKPAADRAARIKNCAVRRENSRRKQRA